MQISRRTSRLTRALIGVSAAAALVLGGSLTASAAEDDGSLRTAETSEGVRAQAAAQADLQRTLAAAHPEAAATPEGPQANAKERDVSAAPDAQSEGGASISAVNPTFTAGSIINDSLFYTGSAMTAAQVQTFLTQKGSGCTAGSLCVKNYRQTTYTQAADQMCGQYVGATNETAATIVYRVGKLCGISQKVLLTLIQKESSLIAATKPTAGDYETATGYGCADTEAVCDKYYYGFYNQVYNAAWQFKRYLNPPGRTKDFTYFPVGTATAIQYNYDTTCGSSKVTIKNAATAALYYYTPYQPNAAALKNLYGTGDKCSSYGNRNFFTVYSDWFGSPNAALDKFFSDVNTGASYYADVQFLARLGIAVGVVGSDGKRTFTPAHVMTNGEFASYLYRYRALPFTAPKTASFSDVGTGSSYFTAVEWLKSAGIVTVPADKKFRPSNPLTRQTVSAWLTAYEQGSVPGLPAASTTPVTRAEAAHDLFLLYSAP